MNMLAIIASKYLIVVPAVAVLYFSWKLHSDERRRFLIIAVISLPLAYVIAKIGSHFYFDARPFAVTGIAPLIPHAADNGFPSDHTLLAAAIASVVTLFDTRIGIALWIVTLAIGAARVYAGVHHPIDILGSVLIAAAATCAVAYFFRKNSSVEN